MICINDIIRWSNGISERLLWTDGVVGYFINIDHDISAAVPVLKTLSQTQQALSDGVAKVIEDPYLFASTEKLSEKHKLIRDQRWNVIERLVATENEPQIYDRKIRGKLIKQASIEHGLSFVAIYKYLRIYWQRGKTQNALLPDYNNSGGRNKSKILGEKKVGRPRKFKHVIGEGVNVTPEDLNKFVKALDTHYYIPNGKIPEEVYNLLLQEHYSTEVRYDKDGIKYPIIDNLRDVPTLRQFMYWFKEKLDIERSLRTREGDKNFELNERSVLGSSQHEGLWATNKYQIDATVGDIYLVSSYKSGEIIGRPVIYFVIDVFSRMIVGYYVGLEGPSWMGMAMALANAMTGKVTHCARYDKEISAEDWPCYHVPEALLCDRGEGEGKAIETACHSLDIRIENTPPYRADWKAIVERYFKTTNEYVKRRVPGGVLPDFNTRTGHDYRLDASLDLYHFNRLIIEMILYHNNHHFMKHYMRSEEVITEGILPIPRDLWNWSVAKSHPRVRDERQILLSLMPRDTATVTHNGIMFKQLKYSSERAIKEQWFLKANVQKSWKVNISYDPRNMNKIYLWEVGATNFDICDLLKSQKVYFDKDVNDIEFYFDYKEYEYLQKEQESKQAISDLSVMTESIVESAKAKLKKTEKSKSAQVKDIRENRRQEKEHNRKEESFNLTDSKPQDIKPTMEQPPDSYSYPTNLDFLKRKMEEN